MYLIPAQGQNLLTLIQLTKVLAIGKGKKITYARWQLKSSGENTVFMIPGSLRPMYELLATTSVSDLRPRGHSRMEIRNAEDRLLTACVL